MPRYVPVCCKLLESRLNFLLQFGRVTAPGAAVLWFLFGNMKGVHRGSASVGGRSSFYALLRNSA